MKPVSKVQIISPYAALDLSADALTSTDPANFNPVPGGFTYDPAPVLDDELPGLGNPFVFPSGNTGTGGTVPGDDDTLPGDDTIPGDDTVPGDDDTLPGDDTIPGDDTQPGLGNDGTGPSGNWIPSLDLEAGGNEAVTFGSLTYHWIGNTGNYLDRLGDVLRKTGRAGDMEEEYNDLASDYDTLAAAFADAAEELEELLENVPDGEMTAQQLWNSEWGASLRTLLTGLMEDYQELRERSIVDPSQSLSFDGSHISFWNQRNPFAGQALPGFITGDQTLTESFNALLAGGFLSGARVPGGGNGNSTGSGGLAPGGDLFGGNGASGGSGAVSPGGNLFGGNNTGGNSGALAPSDDEGAIVPASSGNAVANVFDAKPANDDADPFQYLGESDGAYDWLGDILGADIESGDVDAGPYDLQEIMRVALGDAMPLDDWLSPLLPPDGLAAISYSGMDPNGAMPSIFSVGGTQFAT